MQGDFANLLVFFTIEDSPALSAASAVVGH